VVVVVALVGHPTDLRFRSFLAATAAGISTLLPVLGILLISSEWSQRTGMVTFALVPRRSRVVAAKLGAAVVLSLAALAVAAALSAIGTAICSPDVEGVWTLSAGLLGQIALYVVTAVVIGLGFGSVLLSSAPAIVTFYLLPLGWSALGSIHAIEPTAKWLDQNRSMNDITDRLLSGTEWARVGTTLALWLVLPLAVGLWRIRRSEIR
jgi:ABC-type transport system involved in multi-copper enzyme maturation permease subunit